MEDEFELRFEDWLDDAPAWASFFEQVASCSADLETELLRLELVTDLDTERARKLRRSAGQRAVPVPGVFTGSTDDVSALALAFARGEVAALAIPYQPWDGSS
jgi:hypothetical protein